MFYIKRLTKRLVQAKKEIGTREDWKDPDWRINTYRNLFRQKEEGTIEDDYYLRTELIDGLSKLRYDEEFLKEVVEQESENWAYEEALEQLRDHNANLSELVDKIKDDEKKSLIACAGGTEQQRQEAITHLIEKYKHGDWIKYGIQKIKSQEFLKELVNKDEVAEYVREALKHISDQDFLKKYVKRDDLGWGVRETAIEHIRDKKFLQEIIESPDFDANAKKSALTSIDDIDLLKKFYVELEKDHEGKRGYKNEQVIELRENLLEKINQEDRDFVKQLALKEKRLPLRRAAIDLSVLSDPEFAKELVQNKSLSMAVRQHAASKVEDPEFLAKIVLEIPEHNQLLTYIKEVLANKYYGTEKVPRIIQDALAHYVKLTNSRIDVITERLITDEDLIEEIISSDALPKNRIEFVNKISDINRLKKLSESLDSTGIRDRLRSYLLTMVEKEDKKYALELLKEEVTNSNNSLSGALVASLFEKGILDKDSIVELMKMNPSEAYLFIPQLEKLELDIEDIEEVLKSSSLSSRNKTALVESLKEDLPAKQLADLFRKLPKGSETGTDDYRHGIITRIHDEKILLDLLKESRDPWLVKLLVHRDHPIANKAANFILTDKRFGLASKWLDEEALGLVLQKASEKVIPSELYNEYVAAWGRGKVKPSQEFVETLEASKEVGKEYFFTTLFNEALGKNRDLRYFPPSSTKVDVLKNVLPLFEKRKDDPNAKLAFLNVLVTYGNNQEGVRDYVKKFVLDNKEEDKVREKAFYAFKRGEIRPDLTPDEYLKIFKDRISPEVSQEAILRINPEALEEQMVPEFLEAMRTTDEPHRVPIELRKKAYDVGDDQIREMLKDQLPRRFLNDQHKAQRGLDRPSYLKEDKDQKGFAVKNAKSQLLRLLLTHAKPVI